MSIELSVSGAGWRGNHRWGVILAGGEGQRVRSFLKTEFGLDRPKQFCTVVGRRTMLRHTIDRVLPAFEPNRLLTVVGRNHLPFAAGDLCDRDPRTIVTIPFNRETGASILLSLARINAADPEAVVAFFPSDHFILEENHFISYVNGAFEFVSRMPDFLVSLAVEANSLQPGYGWMEKGLSLTGGGADRLYNVKKFWEKPGHQQMLQLIEQGCLWNTMTLIGRVETFLALFDRYAAETAAEFKPIFDSIGTKKEQDTVYSVFQSLRPVNFSQEILQQSQASLFALPMQGIYWNDWGEEERIRHDLEFLVRTERAGSRREISGCVANTVSSIELVLDDMR